MLIAGITFCMMGFFLEDISIIKFNSNAVLSILYLAIFGSIVTFTSFYWLLKRINIIILSLISFIIPIIALLLGWIFYNEQLSLKELIGSLFVLFGLLLANFGNMIKLNKLVRKATS
jgi:drug/metabolite transporter (DMT)-like permease